MIATLSFYKDGSRFVTGSNDMKMKVWSMSDFSNVFTRTPDYTASVMHISLHPDDGRIFVLTYDGLIEVIDPDTYATLSSTSMAGGAAGYYLRFVDSNTKYVVGGFDNVAGNNNLHVFDCTTYSLLSSYSTSFTNFDEISILSLSRDGSTLAAISLNTVLPIHMEIYDVVSATISRTFSDNYSPMRWVLFSPHSDDTLYTTSNDQTLKFYKKSPIDSTYYLSNTFFTNDYGFPNCINANIADLLIFSASDKLVFLNISSTTPEVASSQADQEDIFVLDLSNDNQYIGTGMRNG